MKLYRRYNENCGEVKSYKLSKEEIEELLNKNNI